MRKGRKLSQLSMCAAFLLGLVGCVSITQPVAIGKDTYMVTLNARGGFQSDGELLNKSIADARNFCTSLGRDLEVQSTQTSGTQMWTPQNNRVVFKCVER